LKRYRDFNGYLKEIFGERVQKISLDAGLSCPNRDGTISDKGCLFCDRRGSGSGAWIDRGWSIEEQMEKGCQFAERRYGAKKFIAYFQSFTNTYAPADHLKSLYDRALTHPGMVGLSVATRPDCIDHDRLRLLSSYRKDFMVWIEYGLQSAHDRTLSLINRGHDVTCFLSGVRLANEYGLNTCVHVILGLPGETSEMMMETARFLATLPIQGVKIHLLYVVRGTPLAAMYEKGRYQCLDRDTYVELVLNFLEILPPGLVIQRLTGDPIGDELAAPLWAKEKSRNLNLIKKRMEQRNTWQGKKNAPLTALS